jgi:short-subunit dehydrogenase
MEKIKSKNILITGVSTGIGYGTAKAFISRNYKVFGSVRRKEDADKLSKEFGSNFIPLIFDVTDRNAISDAVKKTGLEIKNEGLGCLVNNAGIAFGGPLMHQKIEEIQKQFEVNVLGLLAVTQAFLPLLGAKEDQETLPGRIINISSVGGKIAMPFIGAYNGTKFAVEGISAALRRELLLYGIDVIIVGPGAVSTPIWDKSGNADVYKDTRYYKSLVNFAKYFIEEGKKGFSADAIGQDIVRIFETKKPKTRYALVPHKFRSWTMPQILPDRSLDKLIGKQLGFIK